MRGGSQAGRPDRRTKGVGRHLIVELFGCSSKLMSDPSGLMNLLKEAACLSGANVIGQYAERFEGGGGVSAIVVIKESHMAVHTWPELEYASVDIFTCGEKADPWKAYQIILERLTPRHVSVFEIIRGLSMETRMPLGVEAYASEEEGEK